MLAEGTLLTAKASQKVLRGLIRQCKIKGKNNYYSSKFLSALIASAYSKKDLRQCKLNMFHVLILTEASRVYKDASKRDCVLEWIVSLNPIDMFPNGRGSKPFWGRCTTHFSLF